MRTLQIQVKKHRKNVRKCIKKLYERSDSFIHSFEHYIIEETGLKYAILFLTEPTTPLHNADHGGSYCDSAVEVRLWTLTSLTKIRPDDY